MKHGIKYTRCTLPILNGEVLSTACLRNPWNCAFVSGVIMKHDVIRRSKTLLRVVTPTERGDIPPFEG